MATQRGDSVNSQDWLVTVKKNDETLLLTLEMDKLQVERAKLAMQIMSLKNEPMLRQIARDRLANTLNIGNEVKCIEEDPLMRNSMEDLAVKSGLPRRLAHKFRGRIGKVIARKFRQHYKKEPETQSRIINGCDIDVKVYRKSQLENINRWIKQWSVDMGF